MISSKDSKLATSVGILITLAEGLVTTTVNTAVVLLLRLLLLLQWAI